MKVLLRMPTITGSVVWLRCCSRLWSLEIVSWNCRMLTTWKEAIKHITSMHGWSKDLTSCIHRHFLCSLANFSPLNIYPVLLKSTLMHLPQSLDSVFNHSLHKTHFFMRHVILFPFISLFVTSSLQSLTKGNSVPQSNISRPLIHLYKSIKFLLLGTIWTKGKDLSLIQCYLKQLITYLMVCLWTFGGCSESAAISYITMCYVSGIFSWPWNNQHVARS